MSMRHVVFAACGLLVACAPTKVAPPSPAETDPLRRGIVNDVVGLMSVEFDPAVIALQPMSSEGALRSALHASLRDRGFRVGPAYPDAQAFDCEVITMPGNNYLVRVVVGSSHLSRLWVVSGSHAYEGGAWTRSQ